jgi:hypothetical protein
MYEGAAMRPKRKPWMLLKSPGLVTLWLDERGA